MTQETAAQAFKNRLKSSIENERIEELKRKSMDGQFYRELERPSVDKEKSLVWLCSSGLNGETESLIIAAQDQSVTWRYQQKRITEQPIDNNSECAIRQKNSKTYCCVVQNTCAI